MGWAPGNARSHAARLTHEGWIARVSMPRGHGSLMFATRQGVGVADVAVPPLAPPAPTWWAHLSGCAWVAAWLTVRGREMLGPRELLTDRDWQGELVEPGSAQAVTHRPDLIGVVPGRRPAAIEVELQRKSKARLRAILDLHAKWIAIGRSGACVYICRDDKLRALVLEQARHVGLREFEFRVELLGDIREQARTEAESR